MAIQVNRQIVTDKLVACYDAASPRSYTGDSKWIDLSKGSTDATSAAFPSYTGVNNGAFSFNDLKFADYNTKSALGNIVSVEMWLKLTGNFPDSILFGFLQYAVYLTSANLFGYNTGNGDVYGISAATFNSMGFTNNWKQVVFVMRSDVSYTNNKIYVNTSGQTLSQQQATETPANRNFNNGSGRIGCWLSNTTYCTPMQCAIFRLYNKELTPQEIQNNFEANRTRFGI
jgi:hypothetical protein